MNKYENNLGNFFSAGRPQAQYCCSESESDELRTDAEPLLARKLPIFIVHRLIFIKKHSKSMLAKSGVEVMMVSKKLK